MGCNQNQRFRGQYPLAPQPGLGTQPCYKASDDLWVEYLGRTQC